MERITKTYIFIIPITHSLLNPVTLLVDYKALFLKPKLVNISLWIIKIRKTLLYKLKGMN